MNRTFYLKTLSIAFGTWLLLSFCTAESFGQAKNQGSGNANGESPSGETVALPRFAVIDLGAGFSPWGLNNKGVVIGGNSTSAARVWKSGNFTTLQGVSAYAAGINDHGNIVGAATGQINYATGQGDDLFAIESYLATYWASETATPITLSLELDELDYDGTRGGASYAVPHSYAHGISNAGDIVGDVGTEFAEHTRAAGTNIINYNHYATKFSIRGKPVSLLSEVSGYAAFVGWVVVSDGHWGGNFFYGTDWRSVSFIDGKKIALGWVSAINDDGIGVGLTESVSPPRLPIRSATISDGTVLGPGVAYDINNRKIKDVDGKEISQPEIVGEDNSGNAMLWHHLTSDGKVSPKYIASNLNQLSNGKEWHFKSAGCINDIGMITAIARKKSTNVDHGILLLPIEIEKVWSDQLPGVEVNFFQKTATPKNGTGRADKPYILMGARDDGKAYVKARLGSDIPSSFDNLLLWRLAVKNGEPKPGSFTFDHSKKEVSITADSLVAEGDYQIVVGYDANKDGQLSKSEINVRSEWTFKVISRSRYNTAVTSIRDAAAQAIVATPNASLLLTAFADHTTPQEATAPTTTIARSDPAGLTHNVGILFTPTANPGNSIEANFAGNSFMAITAAQTVSINNWLSDAFESKRQEVLQTFQNLDPSILVYTFDWEFTGTLNFGRYPNSSKDLDMFLAIGKVKFTIRAEVPVHRSGYIDIETGVRLYGVITDLYDFDYDEGTWVIKDAARVQSGYNKTGDGGRVYRTKINFSDTPCPVTFNFY